MSVTTSPRADKPAQAAARRHTPTEDAERKAACERMDAAARSRMMVDAREVAAAAAAFLELLEAFSEGHTANSIAAEVSGEHAEYFRAVARNLLHDAAGAAYAVESFVSFFTSELLDEPKPTRRSR